MSDRLEEAIAQWWSEQQTQDNPGVMRSWYLVAEGISLGPDGRPLSHVGQRYEADLIQQLGLVAYLQERVRERMLREMGDPRE